MAGERGTEQRVTLEELRAGLKLPTGSLHRLRVRRDELRVRLPIDPGEVGSWNDRYTLVGSGPSGDSEVGLTVADDQQPGDQFVDLVYPILPEHRYSLKIELGDGAQPFFLFEDVPFSELA